MTDPDVRAKLRRFVVDFDCVHEDMVCVSIPNPQCRAARAERIDAFASRWEEFAFDEGTRGVWGVRLGAPHPHHDETTMRRVYGLWVALRTRALRKLGVVSPRRRR